MTRRAHTLWRAISISIFVPGLLGWVYSAYLFNSFAQLPQRPDPPTGRVYERGIHGLTVYLTHTEGESLTYWTWISGTIVSVGFLIGAIEDRVWKRRGQVAQS